MYFYTDKALHHPMYYCTQGVCGRWH